MGRRVLAVGLVLLGGCATPGAATLPSLMATRAASDRVKAAPEETQDGDGDGYADPFDVCPVVAGLAPDGCPERDSDGDGFLDSQDKCSEEPGVAPFGCPEDNRDGDEFLDVVDRCPDDPGVEPDGCPIPDSDGDQILDPDDGCDAAKETRNGYLDEDGCPDELPADLAAVTGTLRGVAFDRDRHTLLPRSSRTLDRLVAVLGKYPGVRVEVSGHIPSTGEPSYGRDPSRTRADRVRDYLLEHGIAAERVLARGAGADEWLVSNRTAAGRARNERIEVTILVPW